MNLIYQQWAGHAKPSAHYGAKKMAEYAEWIGADHVFHVHKDPVHMVGPASKYYDKFLPLFLEPPNACDNVMFADTDLFPVEGLSEDIFAGFTGDVALCTEPLQPALRQFATGEICAKNDERWATMVLKEFGVSMPRDEAGRLKVYNTGLVLFSQKAMQAARRHLPPPKRYIDLCAKYKLPSFYAIDQNYMHAFIFHMGLKVQELDNDWNRFVHYTTHGREITGVSDQRTPTTKMVHIQLRGADDWPDSVLYRVANLPQAKWNLPA